jgi:hypothetical protein
MRVMDRVAEGEWTSPAKEVSPTDTEGGARWDIKRSQRPLNIQVKSDRAGAEADHS